MTKTALTKLAIDKFSAMGLKVLCSQKDYSGNFPELVAVYPSKNKYYLVHCITEECISGNISFGLKSEYNLIEFYEKMYSTDLRKAYWAISLFCNLGKSMEIFRYSELFGYKLNYMNKYASLVIEPKIKKEAISILNSFHIEFKDLDVHSYFTMILFSVKDSIKLSDSRRFAKFISQNRLF